MRIAGCRVLCFRWGNSGSLVGEPDGRGCRRARSDCRSARGRGGPASRSSARRRPKLFHQLTEYGTFRSRTAQNGTLRFRRTRLCGRGKLVSRWQDLHGARSRSPVGAVRHLGPAKAAHSRSITSDAANHICLQTWSHLRRWRWA